MARHLDLGAGIVDFHCHIASTEFFPASFLDGVVENMMVSLLARGMDMKKDKVADLYLSRYQDPLCDQLVGQMDDAGIAHAVLLLADFTYALPDCKLTVAEMLARHIAVVERHPGRLSLFAGVDPRWGKDGLALFEDAVSRGQVQGLKVYPPCGFGPSEEIMHPFYEICAQHGLPVLLHVGATSPVLDFEPARPIHLDKAARAFPRVPFILAHGSVHYMDECAMMCSHRPNVYLDVSGYEVAELHELARLFCKNINHKLLFGTDWPVFRLKGTQKDFVSLLVDGDDVFPSAMSETDVECFFFRNARRLLGGHGSQNTFGTAIP
jgi:predicted TIM-barrel fold metal-dependent hydrolase